MSRISEAAVRCVALAALAGCVAGQEDGDEGRADVLPAIKVTVVRDVTIQQRWVQPVGHLSSPFKRRVSVARSLTRSDASTVFVACEELEWAPPDEDGERELASSRGWIHELDMDTGRLVDSVDVGCALTGHAPRTDMFWDFVVADGTTAAGENERLYWVGDSSARLSQGAAALLRAGGTAATMSRLHLGDGPSARLGEVVAIGRVPSIDGGFVLWAAAPGFMGDHRSTPATVLAFSPASSTPLYTLHGGEGFGRQLLAVDDLDGDQCDDLIVSGEWQGRYELDETGKSELNAAQRFAAFSGRTGSVLWDHARVEPYLSGCSLAQGADWDGDGLRDIAVAQQTSGPLGRESARLLVLSAKDGQPLRTFRPLAEEGITIGRVAYADAGPSRSGGFMVICYSRDPQRGELDEPPPCSGVALLSTETGEELARIEEDDADWVLGMTAVVVPVGAGGARALVVTLEGSPDGSDYILRYDLRP